MKKLIVKCAAWEYNDFIISIRPENEKPWRDIPVGMALSKKGGEIIADWLNQNMETLQKIIIKTENDPTV